jgi:serine/threonine-protein kinase
LAAEAARKRRLRVAAAIAGLAGLALISFAIALAASGGGHPRLGVLDAAPRPIDAAAVVAIVADAPPAQPPVDAGEPAVPADAAPTALLEVKTIPPGGTVRIGGDQEGARTAPAQFGLAEGRYVVYAEHAGYAPERRTVDVSHGEHFEIEIAFTHKLPGRGGHPEHVVEHTPPAPENGRLSVKTDPYSDVYEGGKYLGQTPLAEVSLPPGTHELTFKNPKHTTIKKTITIVAGQTQKLSFPLP